MNARQHERLCLAALGAWSVLGGVVGVWQHGWPGLTWVIPGVLLGAVLHKAVMERLPVRCARCAGKVVLNHFVWRGPLGSPSDHPTEHVDTTRQEASFYRCRGCGAETPSSWL